MGFLIKKKKNIFKKNIFLIIKIIKKNIFFHNFLIKKKYFIFYYRKKIKKYKNTKIIFLKKNFFINLKKIYIIICF
ncbi:MAG: hypothetical protein ACAF48_01120 [Candidatus Carsonella ruddii]